MFEIYSIDDNWSSFNTVWSHPSIQAYLTTRMTEFCAATRQIYNPDRPLWTYSVGNYWQLKSKQRFYQEHETDPALLQKNVSRVLAARNLPINMIRTKDWHWSRTRTIGPEANTSGSILCAGARNSTVDTLYIVCKLLFGPREDIAIYRTNSEVKGDFWVLNVTRELIIDIRLSHENSLGLITDQQKQSLGQSIQDDIDNRTCLLICPQLNDFSNDTFGHLLYFQGRANWRSPSSEEAFWQRHQNALLNLQRVFPQQG